MRDPFTPCCNVAFDDNGHCPICGEIYDDEPDWPLSDDIQETAYDGDGI